MILPRGKGVRVWDIEIEAFIEALRLTLRHSSCVNLSSQVVASSCVNVVSILSNKSLNSKFWVHVFRGNLCIKVHSFQPPANFNFTSVSQVLVVC